MCVSVCVCVCVCGWRGDKEVDLSIVVQAFVLISIDASSFDATRRGSL